jgi:hypothetical protein
MEAALPSNLIALLVKLGKMPDEFKVGDQAEGVHGANLVLGFVKRIGDILVASRIQVQSIGLSATDKRGMKHQVLSNCHIHLWEATAPIDSGDYTSFARNLFVERRDVVVVQSYASELGSYYNNTLRRES